MTRQIVSTNREGWARIFSAVRTVESGGRMGTPPGPDYRTGDDPPILLGRTAAAWAKGTSATIAVYAGAPGAEAPTGIYVSAVNKFAAVAANKWVVLAGPNQSGRWYLISAEC